MRVYYGIDPSLTAPGYAWGPYLSESTVMKDEKIKGDDRLSVIYDDVREMVNGRDEYIVAIESVPPYQKGSQSLAMVHGVVRAALAGFCHSVYTVTPSSLKKAATGLGRASKHDMLDALPGDVRVTAEEDNWDDNAVDAWWLRQVAIGTDLGVLETALKEMPIVKKIQ